MNCLRHKCSFQVGYTFACEKTSAAGQASVGVGTKIRYVTVLTRRPTKTHVKGWGWGERKD